MRVRRSKEIKDYDVMKRESDQVVKFVQLQLEQTCASHLYRKELFEWLSC